MAKTKLQAGAELDMLTKEELDGVLNEFVLKMGEGVKFRRIVSSYSVLSNQIVGQGFGPEVGYVWDLRYVFSTFSAATTPASVLWYFNDATAVNLITVTQNTATAVPVTFPKNTFIIHPGELVVPKLASTAVQGPATNINLAFAVIEVPLFHEGQLLL